VKKLLTIVILMIIAATVLGCSSSSVKTHIDKDIVSASLEEQPNTDIVYKGGNHPSMTDGFGVYDQVFIDGLYPGYSGNVPLTIVNGPDRDRLFNLTVSGTDKAKEGYESLPQQYLSWFTIDNSSFAIQKDDSHKAIVHVSVPEDMDYAGKKAELRILVEDTTQTGIVQIAVESRWFITTAN
jgi:hypothetical protein